MQVNNIAENINDKSTHIIIIIQLLNQIKTKFNSNLTNKKF